MIEYSFLSSNGINSLRAKAWEPEGGPKGVILVVHGMNEYIERYEEFGELISKAGYYVACYDQLGHGKSVKSKDEYGYFGENGLDHLLKDIDLHYEILKEKFPSLPIIIFGHSMGSFLVRLYISQKSDKLNGAIIMGTGLVSDFKSAAGKFSLDLMRMIEGDKYRSSLGPAMAFAGYLSHIDNPKTSMDWITSDEKELDKYLADEKSHVIFTVNGFEVMREAFRLSGSKECFRSVKNDLPLLIVSGSEDPVGGFGKSSQRVARLYLAANSEDIKFKLYKNMRHEILHEVGKEKVYKDIISWLEGIIP